MKIPVFDPQKVPVRGLFSHPAPSALLEGEWQGLTNVRWDDRSISVRPGVYEENDVDAGGTFYGGIIVRANNSGDWLAIAAMDVGAGVVKFKYDVWNGTAWASASAWTTVSGTVDTNSFSLPKYGYYDFMAVPNGSGGTSGVFVQNGTDQAMFLDTQSVAVNYVAKVRDLDYPRQALHAAPVMGASGFVDVRTGAMVTSWPVEDTHYNADGTFDPATAASDEGNIQRTGSSPDLVWSLTSGGTAGTSIPAVDDYAWFRCHADDEGDFSGGKQVLIPFDADDNTWFTCCKWYLTGTTAGDLLIHDPSDFKDTKFLVPSKNGISVAVFSIADHAAEDLTDINGLKLVVSNAGLTPESTILFHGLVCGGKAPATRQYAVSFSSSTHLSESAGALMMADASMGNMIDAGCSVADDVVFPVDERIFYAPDVPVYAPNSAEAAKWSNTYNIYARDPGEELSLFGNGENADFSYIGQVTVALRDTDDSNGPGSGAGFETVYATFGNDEAAWSKKAVSGTFTDTVEPLDKTFEKKCPGPYTVSMPTGASLVYANGYAYVVGTRGTSAATRNNGVYVSEKDRPFRFSAVPGDNTDPGRGILISLEDENAMKVVSVSASLVGVSTVLCWSDKAVYTIEPTFAVRIADHGTVAPGSVATANGVVYWVDQDLVVQEMSERIRQVSRYSVHNKLLDVPAAYRKYMSGSIKGGRYFLAHASSSSNTNHRILVFNPDADAWESEDSVPTAVAVQQFLRWNSGNGDRLMYFTPTGGIWEYDRPGTADDDGTLITLTLRTGEFTKDWETTFIGQSQVVCSDQNSRTITVTRTARKPAATSVGTMTTDAGGSETSVFRVDTDSNEGFAPGIEGCSVDVQWSVQVQHPFKIHSLKVEGRGEANFADNG